MNTAREIRETSTFAPGPKRNLRAMTLAQILPYMLAGYRVSRQSVSATVFLAKGASVEYLDPSNRYEKVSAGDMLMIEHNGKFHPLTLDSYDILANDWVIVDTPN